MRNLILILLLAVGSFTALSAQTPTTTANQKGEMKTAKEKMTDSEFEKLIFNSFKINFRTYAYEKLALTEDQIIKFDPIYIGYMNDKSRLVSKRQRLVNKFSEEMAENDTKKDEDGETADFIENYWEIDIDQMELKKDYFDRFEDVIGYRSAMRFFLIEEDVQQQLSRNMWVEKIPTLMITPNSNRFANNVEVNAYHNWMMNVDGKVSVSHEYTKNGLNQLAKVAESLAMAGGVETSNMMEQKKKIMMLADDLQDDWTSLKHADKTRQAFIMVADMFANLSKTKAFMTKNNVVMELKEAAMMIKKDVKLTDQAAHVYNFFEKAERVVNTLANTADQRVSNQLMKGVR